MRVLRFSQFGAPSVLQIQNVEKPQPGRGEVLIEVNAASVNPSDVKNVQGMMAQTTLPRTPGRDFAGIVVEGPVEMLGREVWGTGGDLGFSRDGSHAQYLLLPETAICEKPHILSFAEAAAVGVSYITAWSALVNAGQITAHDVVAVVGANGSVGSAAIQIARWKQATVIGLVRNRSHEQRVLDLGADHVADMQHHDIRQEVLDLTAGRGATLVFDTVGGEMFEPSLGLLAQRGRLIEIAATRVRRVSFDLRDFYHRESRLFGVDSLQLDASACASILRQLKPGFESGSLQPSPVDKRYALDQAVKAYEDVLSGSSSGKIVIIPR